MHRSKKLFLTGALFAFAGAAVFACGPFFGIEVLRSRQTFLLAPPTVSFETELRGLVPKPADNLPVVEPGAFDNTETTRMTIEAKQLLPAELARVTAMAQEATGEAAYTVGQGLPSAVRLYAAGAVSFRKGQTDSARAYFRNILALPEEERRARELWARFMLGRIAAQDANQAEASAQFETVRTLVRQGAADDLGLAVASLGEEARIAWRQHDVAKSVALYAQQVAYGSHKAANSLVAVAGLILHDANVLDLAVQDATARKLIFICLNGNSGRRFFVDPSPNAPANKTDIVAALERHGLTKVEGAGLLAAAEYAQGNFDAAGRLASFDDPPMSAWILAKLALRKGDRAEALRNFDRALKTYPPALEESSTLRAEAAALRVSRGDYVQALDLFSQASAKGWDLERHPWSYADYWGDAAYLAERVLTVDELRKYVSEKPSGGAKFVSSRFRNVLARRLMRAGRRSEATRYFDDATVRKEAEKYDNALNRAAGWWRLSSNRARDWFTAAVIARASGMELLGFEKEPDFAMLDGEYVPFDENPSPSRPDPYTTEDERKRFEASKPERDVRFQYRLTAVDEAMKSADLLPPRSQAFAAVLCQSTRWIIDRDPKRAETLYQRYLHQGAHVPWGRSFGRTCPAPDFQSASLWSTTSRRVKRVALRARSHPIYLGFAAALSAAALLTVLIYLRRSRNRVR